MHKTIVRSVVLILAVCLGGCPADDSSSSVDDTGTGGGNDDAAAVCDPVGLTPEVGVLLNAPLAADVEVIQKDPQHPGPAGPTDLP